MSIENRISFTNVNACLIFEVAGEGFLEETEIKVDCGEDIEELMKLYFKKDWNALFENYHARYTVDYATFKGIEMSGSDKNKNKFFAICDGLTSSRASATLSYDNLKDENANKIELIRKIVGN